MKIVVYLCSIILAITGIALVVEYGLEQFLPDTFRGYLIEEDGGNVKWAIGPFDPAQPATGFNTPIALKKPADTIRIVALGASGTEGWLSAKTVFNKYGQTWTPESLSSYSRALEFSMNAISGSSSKRIEVINLGVAAYNITDVIRMLKDSLKLDPDLFLIQIGGNETWTAGRSKWSSYFADDIPYLYAELGYEILSDTQAGWKTLATGGNAFNPLALFSSGPQPIVIEPPGRTEGLEPRLENYGKELERLADFLQGKGIPALFLIPSQNIADFRPFGSMARAGTSNQQLEKLNQLLVEALAMPPSDSKDTYLEILELDDGLAEANFQLGNIYLQENDTDRARFHFWKANDRDLVLKRLPSAFHDISRSFVEKHSFEHLDVMKFYESKSSSGVVGYNWLDDDVHPSRKGQFELGNEIVKIIVSKNLLQSAGYTGALQLLPTFANYDAWTGFDEKAAGNIAYLKGAHNFLAFGRYRQRIRWDPQPDQFLDPILEDLDFANNSAPSDQSRFLSALLNLFLGRTENSQRILAAMDCRSSVERSAHVYLGMTTAAKIVFGNSNKGLKEEMQRMLVSEGCEK